ncbi:MAG: flagellar protein FlgN [Ruminococcus sp.]|nr:flagellar protein FlgN [Ruminococcus sp.]MCM1380653.1 flagellar protein FlgN [Muribaculaceae bacterium]MCM1479485.1 flagellar protein FlgN [Muribaculaceae bacterium]
MPDYKAIIKFFDEYILHYKSFLKFEFAKADMINKGLVEQLSDALTTEQALIMKTNTLETRRIKLVEGCGDTFDALIEGAPDEFREKLKDQHKELSDLIYKIKELNDNAGIIVSERLRKIQMRTAELDVYDGKGALRREHATRSAISRNV